MKKRILERFSVSKSKPFRAFMHCRQKKGQAVQDYYHTTAKQRLGSLDALKYDHIVYGLTDGLLQEMKITEATLQFFTPPRGLQKHNMWKAFPGGSVREVEVLTLRRSLKRVTHCLVVCPRSTQFYLPLQLS